MATREELELQRRWQQGIRNARPIGAVPVRTNPFQQQQPQGADEGLAARLFGEIIRRNAAATQPVPVREKPAGVVFDLAGQAEAAGQRGQRAVVDALRNPGNPFGMINFLTGAAQSLLPALGFDTGNGPGLPQPTPAKPAAPKGPNPFEQMMAIAGLDPATGRPATGPVGASNPFGGGGMGAAFGVPVSPQYQRILQLEGGFRDGKFQRSPAGAWGPAQLMPGTAPEAMALAGYSKDDKRWQTDAAINVQAGQAYYNKQLQDFGDPVLAAAAYNAGPGRVRQAIAQASARGGNWMDFLPAETKTYVNNFQMGGAGMPQAGTGFNPNVFGPVLQGIDQAAAAMNTPWSASIPAPPDIPFPEMPEAPKRNFEGMDKALEAMRPVMDDELTQRRISRAGLFDGLARGLASIPEGAGLGQVLASLGSGMLAGRVAGEREVQARMDAYDEKMTQFKVLQYRNEQAKADTLFQDAVAERNALWSYNMAKYNDALRKQGNDFKVDYGPAGLTVQRRVGDQLEIQTIPNTVASAVWAAQQKVGVLGQQAELGARAAMADAAMDRQVIVAGWQQKFLQEAGAGEGGALTRQAMQGFLLSSQLQVQEAVQQRLLPALVGPEKYEKLAQQAANMALSEKLTPGTKEYAEVLERHMAGIFTATMANNPKLREQFQNMMPQLWESYWGRKQEDARYKARTDSRGRTTTEVQY